MTKKFGLETIRLFFLCICKKNSFGVGCYRYKRSATKWSDSAVFFSHKMSSVQYITVAIILTMAACIFAAPEPQPQPQPHRGVGFAVAEPAIVPIELPVPRVVVEPVFQPVFRPIVQPIVSVEAVVPLVPAYGRYG